MMAPRGRAATSDFLRSRIRIKSLNFMRGRTFLRKFLIIDEAQNLKIMQCRGDPPPIVCGSLPTWYAAEQSKTSSWPL